jgi:hypothetical protein
MDNNIVLIVDLVGEKSFSACGKLLDLGRSA